MTGTPYSLEVQPNIPAPLARLHELADDLLYSWDRHVRNLFYWLDPRLWEACGHNPRVFLRRLDQKRLDRAAGDPLYLKKYNGCLSAYDTYHRQEPNPDIAQHLDLERDLIAYFCAEFGFYESLQIYSGGLGILAGDHCKAASDLVLPFVAVGLLYRQGYFHQTIDAHGRQEVQYIETDFADIPVFPAVDGDGREVHVHVPIHGHDVEIKLWRAKAGHITLFLLDSDVPGNSPENRRITHQLYGGDLHTRIQQELILGIGGVRALRAMGVAPTIWHINEGHAALQAVERCRELVALGLEFDAALEAVAAATVFTTHTPVPAGHDIFSHELMHAHLGGYVRELGINEARFRALGESPENGGGFNLTALALRCSRFHNGVSQIHGDVASEMLSFVWPQVPDAENPIAYVTNGVHVPTFLSREWSYLFDAHFSSDWRDRMLDAPSWERIADIPNHAFWSTHQSIKTTLLDELRRRLEVQYRRNGCGVGEIKRLTQYLHPEVLVVGFARRFATYKRATLLFRDPERLARLVNDAKRPVVFVFAGKAHPNDQPGRELMRVIFEHSRRPEFEGRILLVEGYDLALGRKLVSGVDVWLNTPEYPLEASGTSGQKAGINGVINLSVLDGWWAEGYDGDNGWAITPHDRGFDANERDHEEALALLDILESQVLPLYYTRRDQGYPEDWLRKSKRSMSSTLPRFNSQRMVMDYVARYYAAAARQGRRLADDGFAQARALTAWKSRVAHSWPHVSLRRLDAPLPVIKSGGHLQIRVAVNLGGLDPEDVTVECLLSGEPDPATTQRVALSARDRNDAGETLFELDLTPQACGLHHYRLRLYPSHPLLTHPFETGYMLWL